MFIITITRWKKKLVGFLVIIALFVGLGMGVSWFLTPEDSATTAPADQNLQDDVINQPVKVQGEPADTDKDVDKNTDKEVKPSK